VIKVGTFTKSTDGAPVQQAITGVGFQPRALVLWTSAQAYAAAWTDNLFLAMGMTDGTTQRAVAESGKDNETAAGFQGARWANAVLTIIDWTGAVLAEAQFVSFDDDGFTLNWTTNNASAYYIHYLALAGDDLTDVNLVEWTMTTAAGQQAVTGVGFQPDCVLHLGAYQAALGNGIVAHFAFGAMDGDGGQFSTGHGISRSSNMSYSSLTNTTAAFSKGRASLVPNIDFNVVLATEKMGTLCPAIQHSVRLD
jgi:hypothetical protein